MAGVDLAREVVCSPVPVPLPGRLINLPKSDLIPNQRKQLPGHGAEFSKGSGFSVARKGLLVSLSGTEFSRGQSPYGVSMEVTPGSSGFPGEAGPGQPGTLLVPSVVREKSLEGSVRPSLVAGFSFTAVSGTPLLVDGSGGYRSALAPVFQQGGLGISQDRDLSALFRGFVKLDPPHSPRIPAWDLSLVLCLLMKSPYEPLHLASLRDIVPKSSFLLTLASALRVSELHGLSAEVHHSKGWASMTFSLAPDFLAKTQLPGDVSQSDFSIPALMEYFGNSEGYRLLCPVRAVRECLRRTKDCRPRCSRLFARLLSLGL
ncbi:hypothetical protein E2C01_040374 [Portunus trituberculatus]|uniref:Uncharacterized protein n=1 Tax=Portunus trituberculatus TaxID=210409 RepID=A0A5B7FP18_PORTR|nr:hypothetical protein [Portunus trituberculatus]